jgi:CRISPR-associated protein Cas4
MLKKKVKIKKKEHHVPEGTITYSDLNIPAKPLFSKRNQLTGKPDYILHHNGHIIPVEVKSGNYVSPQKHHLLQLAGYCSLCEEYYCCFVKYGFIVHPDNKFKISFNPKLRFELEKTLIEMRQVLQTGRCFRNHENIKKCQHCTMRHHCSEKLC